MVATFNSRELMEILIEQYWEAFAPWFKNLKPFKEERKSINLAIWVKVKNVPWYLWHDDLFIMLSNKWGRFVQMNESMKLRKQFDGALLMVEVQDKSTFPLTTKQYVNNIVYLVQAMVESDALANPTVSNGNHSQSREIFDIGEKEGTQDKTSLDIMHNLTHGNKFQMKEPEPVSQNENNSRFMTKASNYTRELDMEN